MSQQSSAAPASVTSFSVEAPPQTIDIKDPVDTSPSDIQPPGVDVEREPQSLEEALMS